MNKPEDKTQTQAPKADPTKPANPFAPFFTMPSFASAMPFAGAMPFGAEVFAPWLREHAARVEKISEEVAAFERAMIERLKTSTADLAALARDTLDYVQQVGAQWRTIAIDTAKRAADATVRG